MPLHRGVDVVEAPVVELVQHPERDRGVVVVVGHHGVGVGGQADGLVGEASELVEHGLAEGTARLGQEHAARYPSAGPAHARPARRMNGAPTGTTTG